MAFPGLLPLPKAPPLQWPEQQKSRGSNFAASQSAPISGPFLRSASTKPCGSNADPNPAPWLSPDCMAKSVSRCQQDDVNLKMFKQNENFKQNAYVLYIVFKEWIKRRGSFSSLLLPNHQAGNFSVWMLLIAESQGYLLDQQPFGSLDFMQTLSWSFFISHLSQPYLQNHDPKTWQKPSPFFIHTSAATSKSSPWIWLVFTKPSAQPDPLFTATKAP